ncbi:hypothetical protein BMETH_2219_0 [methanotrophic bacterial endosymbiont of Bathymodiolus sp.]|nr:hypothetical protein BMETH_2219_0 [methanotrophic bacterial endosymbiont of Bathymodiolus sp.]
MSRIILLGINTNHNRAIGITLITRILAHTIGYYMSSFRSRGNHCTAETHTEAID